MESKRSIPVLSYTKPCWNKAVIKCNDSCTECSLFGKDECIRFPDKMCKDCPCLKSKTYLEEKRDGLSKVISSGLGL